MWSKDGEDTITDENGRVVYFGIERFIRDICLGDCCFICGAKPASVPFNDEHILSNWLLRRYDLHGHTITLPNGTSYRYDRYTIPCCEACNSLMGRVLEEPMRALVEGGYEAVRNHIEQDGTLLAYVWIGLIFLKTHLKDRRLRANLDQRKGPESISENLEYSWDGLHYLHTLVRCFVTGAGIHPSALGSFVVIRVQEGAEEQPFDFADFIQTQTIVLRMGGFAFLAAFNDGRRSEFFLKQKLERITGPVSGLQLRELMADLCWINCHLEGQTILQSAFNLEHETHVITADSPLPVLEEQDRRVRGALLKYFFGKQIRNIKSYNFSEEQIEALMESGHLSFMFDSNGEFFTSSIAEPPAVNTEPEA
jgi:hypothetical protein